MTDLRAAHLGRVLLLLLVAGGAAGPGLRASQPAPVAEARAAAAPESGPSRLKALVEAAEKALEAEDAEQAEAKADEAEALVADWSTEVLRRTDIAPLIDRLQAVRRQLDEVGQEGDALRLETRVVELGPAEALTERSRVQAAEQGAVYDFPIDLNDKVLAWVHAFTNQKRGFVEGSLSRATQYLPMVRQVFAEEGIPQDLAYLAVIESGYKNSAKSRAKAVGMWQFIRSTGRLYGLTGNAWVEERRDPIKATRAAARYLKRLYEITGDWYLALVGYNAGPLTTERAIAALGTRNYWDLARSRYLRNETKHYVPELCAAILIGRHPEKYGLTVVQMAPYAYETVEVDRQTSLTVVARHAKTDVEALKALNPELLRATTPPGTYTLRVPPGSGPTTQRALAGIPSRERLDFKAYVVKKGDTPTRVAARFKVSPEDLLAANDLKASQFKPGRRIQVPPPSLAPIDEADLRTPAERAAAKLDQPLEPLPAIPGTERPEAIQEPKPQVPQGPVPSAVPVKEPVAVPRPAGPEPRPTTHLVKPGETLFSISTRYGVELKDLRKWNKIKGNMIQAGQRLRLQKP